MENTFKIKQPEGSLLFLSSQEFQAFCKDYQRENPHMEVEGGPDSFPCVGFPVYTVYESDRKDKRVFAFVYPHADYDDKFDIYSKSAFQTVSRFESALLMC